MTDDRGGGNAEVDVPENPIWTPFQKGTMPHPDHPMYGAFEGCYVMLNSRYQVVIRPLGGDEEVLGPMFHLSIKRNDKMPMRDWRDMQRRRVSYASP
jgi:hypothetical protein